MIAVSRIVCLLAGCACLCASAGGAPLKRPNIVLIVADDYGWAEVGFNGSAYYETPRLDALAAKGLVFTNGYAPSANCAPSRACFLAGLNTPRHGMYTVKNSDRGEDTQRKLIPTENVRTLPEHFTTIAHVLAEHGYRTGSFGKWHISKSPKLQGFDVAFAGNLSGHPKTYWAPYKVVDVIGKEGEYLTDRVTDEAIQFIDDSAGKSFFLYLPFFAVHDPLQGKPDLVAKYATKPVRNGQGRSTDYSAMIENMDASIGRVVDRLQKNGLTQNTVVIFTSDNGGAQWISNQAPLKGGKGCYYEGGIRVPFLIYSPTLIPKGQQTNVPVSGLDIFPTIVELTGATVPNGLELDGDSLVEIVRHPEQEPAQRALHWHFPIYLHAHKGVKVTDGVRDPYFRTRPGGVVRLGDWKLHEYFEDGALELYNLKDDIGETTNLAAANPEVVAKLKALMNDWRARSKAPVPTALNPLYDPTVTISGYESDPKARLKYVSDQYKKVRAVNNLQ
jgi:arylsulfatase A-like enzyme